MVALGRPGALAGPLAPALAGPRSSAAGTLVIAGGGSLPPAILATFVGVAAGTGANVAIIPAA